MVNLDFSIGDLQFKNPVLTASGTFGYGPEFNSWERFDPTVQSHGLLARFKFAPYT